MIKKRFSRFVLPLLCSFTISPLSHADSYVAGSDEQSAADGINSLTEYLYNLGTYFGFDVKDPATTIEATTLDLSTIQASELSVFYMLFGAIPVNTFSDALSYFVPSSDSNSYATLNGQANATFTQQNFSSPSSNTISANALIDQKNSSSTYQQDPVSQDILNVMTTPDYSYCMNYDMTEWVDANGNATWSNCSYLYQFQVMANVIGTLPTAYDFFSASTVQPFVSQLNSNTLTSPLMYNNTAGTTTADTTKDSSTSGLSNPNQTQAQQAENFIRYATNGGQPISLAQLSDYDGLYQNAIRDLSSSPTPSNQDIINTKSAQAALSRYLNQVRSYAAQRSVAVSNLYYVLSKRMPQSQSGTTTTSGSSSSSSSDTNTSQALSEFQMASWRLNNPNASSDNQWLNQINTASTASVQKEIAVLLSEINYQLYLNRMQTERLLLTNSILLIVSLGQNPPPNTINTDGTAPSNTTGS